MTHVAIRHRCDLTTRQQHAHTRPRSVFSSMHCPEGQFGELMMRSLYCSRLHSRRDILKRFVCFLQRNQRLLQDLLEVMPAFLGRFSAILGVTFGKSCIKRNGRHLHQYTLRTNLLENFWLCKITALSCRRYYVTGFTGELRLWSIGRPRRLAEKHI